MKDLSNPLEYGAPYQAILRDYYSKFQIKNYKTKPYFIIGNAENAILVQFFSKLEYFQHKKTVN